jgi:hypothetical protein
MYMHTDAWRKLLNTSPSVLRMYVLRGPRPAPAPAPAPVLHHNNHNNHNRSQSKILNPNPNSLFGLLKQTVNNVIKESSFFNSPLVSQKSKSDRLLMLIVKDILCGPHGTILGAKDTRDHFTTNDTDHILAQSQYMLPYATQSAIWVCLVMLDLYMAYHICLFGSSQDQVLQFAWFKSMLLWLILELGVVSWVAVVVVQVLTPLLAMRAVQRAVVFLGTRKQVQVSDFKTAGADDANLHLNIHLTSTSHPSTTNRIGDVQPYSDTYHEPYSGPFNAARYLFVSCRLAELFLCSTNRRKKGSTGGIAGGSDHGTDIVSNFCVAFPPDTSLDNGNGNGNSVASLMIRIVLGVASAFVSMPWCLQDSIVELCIILSIATFVYLYRSMTTFNITYGVSVIILLAVLGVLSTCVKAKLRRKHLVSQEARVFIPNYSSLSSLSSPPPPSSSSSSSSSSQSFSEYTELVTKVTDGKGISVLPLIPLTSPTCVLSLSADISADSQLHQLDQLDLMSSGDESSFLTVENWYYNNISRLMLGKSVAQEKDEESLSSDEEEEDESSSSAGFSNFAGSSDAEDDGNINFAELQWMEKEMEKFVKGDNTDSDCLFPIQSYDSDLLILEADLYSGSRSSDDSRVLWLSNSDF